ncbi:hypothetical protein GCM10009665_73440 [Kitasatospora nipponensis]|uniref:Uncharacterized protein n=1 Tax=Kitasatospora nipponensis TaxID=258049 RepID=A0ABN1X0E8_9ACTN
MNQHAILRARMLLLSSGDLSRAQRLRAFRTLAPASPAVYRPKLARLLMKISAEPALRTRPEARRDLLTEALTTIEALDPADPQRPALLADVLTALRDC